MATARLENVTKRYPGHLAVDRINLSIEDGEFLVLVGPSGCGKSTTLRMIAGLEHVTEGNIWVGDRRVNDVSPRDRDVAMVFQNYALYPHMNVFMNLSYSLRLRRVPRERIETLVNQVAATLDLSPLLNRKPVQLSGGQRQRVALGRAIIREPKLFLMDEPLSNLDAKLRVQTRTEITRLQRRLGVTTVYVTHDQSEAMTMGSRIAVMNDGKILQIAVPRDLYRNPANSFVAEFVGTPPMNLLSVRLDRSGSVDRLTGGGVRIPCPESAVEALEAVGQGFRVGFRPEDAVISGSNTGAGFFGQVVAVEDLGHEALVTVSAGNAQFIARLPPARAEQIRHGQRIAFGVEPSKLRFFDGRKGAAVAFPLDESLEPVRRHGSCPL
ncbi:MAG: sn-glycerol-3-phosphate ABC transporter ATP-binding protein UgpC [Rhodobacteraceae bacterium]|nr:sn-glycerol-3-phosphate ABC transporter ATP-binding protein UgpC [Paracoccaceae bacterium]